MPLWLSRRLDALRSRWMIQLSWRCWTPRSSCTNNVFTSPVHRHTISHLVTSPAHRHLTCSVHRQTQHHTLSPHLYIVTQYHTCHLTGTLSHNITPCHLTYTLSHNITPCHLPCTSSHTISHLVTSPVHRHIISHLSPQLCIVTYYHTCHLTCISSHNIIPVTSLVHCHNITPCHLTCTSSHTISHLVALGVSHVMHSINVRYLFTYFCHLTCTSSHNITPCHLTCTSSRNITPVTSPVHHHTQCFTNKWTDFTANWYKWSMGKQWNDQLQGSRGQRSMSQKVEVRLEGQAAASFSTPFSQ